MIECICLADEAERTTTMKVCNYCGGSIAEQLVGRLNAESVAFMRDRYRDESGYPKGYGEYEDACFIGKDVAEAAIAAAEGGTK